MARPSLPCPSPRVPNPWGDVEMALPDFLIAGAPKAGTTALHVALARHPQLYLSRVKEPKFFLTDGPPRAQGGPGDAKTLREQVWQRTRTRPCLPTRHPAR